MNSRRKKIAILDYGINNLYSVFRACEIHNSLPVLVRDPNLIKDFDALILPGVGAYGAAMQRLEELNLVSAILSFIKSGKQVLGICLGMQLLLEESYEFSNKEGIKGIGFFKGSVKPFNFLNLDETVPIPHVGWNNIEFDKQSEFLTGLPSNSLMYFVHSLYADMNITSDIASYTCYGDIKFASSIQLENVFATQFHPEKSAKQGLLIYSNFINSI